uniref:C2H2-type domain-containing protein n=1 Tax=Heterorhabditis bacteriophora TaxID=37862 RepID=A0A1I7XAA4_HETBA
MIHRIQTEEEYQQWVREKTAGEQYVNEVARKYGEKMRRMNQKESWRVCTAEAMSTAAIHRRLSLLRTDCDLLGIGCGVAMCGRVFDSIPVLAWHISYSHHDLGSRSAMHAMCYVCGIQLDNVKGKTVHLTTKHRDLCMEHNQQCLQQRNVVISPHAPAAMRLIHYETEQILENSIDNQSLPVIHDFHNIELLNIEGLHHETENLIQD